MNGPAALGALLQTKLAIQLAQMAFNCISLMAIPQHFVLWRSELQARDTILKSNMCAHLNSLPIRHQV